MKQVVMTVRLDDDIKKDVDRIAEDDNTSTAQVVRDALMLYRDYRYNQDKAVFLNQEIIKIFDAQMELLLSRINARSNTLLSALAINQAVTAMVIADNIEVSADQLEAYRRAAVDILKESNQVFTLDKAIKDG